VITATSRVCAACGRLLPDTPPHVCTHCDRLEVPPLDAWSHDLKCWLAGRAVASVFAPHLDGPPLRKWTALLRSQIAGRAWHGQVIPYAASEADCFAVAVKEVEQWVRDGKPDLY
jgi:hypothetical protein